MPKTINLTGAAGKTYNLDELETENRTSTTGLTVEIWKWNPDLPSPYNSPNPPNLQIGRIWLSKFVDKDSDDYKNLLN